MFFIFSFLFLVTQSHASACCSGAQSIPAFITSDDRATLGFSSSYSKVIGDAPEQGVPVFRKGQNQQTNLTQKIETAYQVSERWQIGGIVSLQQRQLNNKTYHSSFGDSQLSTAYEFLPERTYSFWKPRGFAFLGLTLPTGKSIYETDQSQGISSSGRGFYSVGVGNFWQKKWNYLDANFMYQFSYSFPRSFEEPDGQQIRVIPSFSEAIAVGSGFSWKDFRVGFRIQPNFFHKKKIFRDAQVTETASEMYWDSVVLLSYAPKEYLGLSLSYNDQTILGPARNTTLSRTISLSGQYLWGL